jgi:DNA-directed RNA polymerase subunit RPC12/RpoP
MACKDHGKNVHANKRDGIVRCSGCNEPVFVKANLPAGFKPKRKK